jgi:16S rRNA (guanine527-N7)-methyltransferase
MAAAGAVPRGARVVDLGSGGGFPGIVVAIARPDLDLVLVEIRERRAHFLRHVVRTLELRCEVARREIEDPPDVGFDFALVRALAPADQALPMAAPWLNEAGEIWIWTRELSMPSAFLETGAIDLGERGRVARVVPRGTP